MADGGIHLSQTKYIKELLKKEKMGDPKAIATPMVSGQHLSAFEDDDFRDATLYRSVAGALQHVTLTRPELSFSVRKVCQYMKQPKKSL